MKITVEKDKKKLNIDSACWPAWEKAGWKKAEQKAEKNTADKNTKIKASE